MTNRTAETTGIAYGIRRDRESGDWMVLDAFGREVAERLPESLTSTEALALVFPPSA